MSQKTQKSLKSASLEGKVVLITGAAQRLGAMTARLLHAEGANLVIHYRNSRKQALELQKELQQKRDNSVVLIQADLLDIANATVLVKQACDTWGRLDILINNASSFYPTPIGKVTETQWNDLMGTNLKAPFFLSQAAAEALQKTAGCVVSIVDIHAERPMQGHAVYNMAKAGHAMLVKTLAFELGPDVRVNGVAPGAIMWPSQPMDEITRQRIVSKTYLKRKGEPEDIARTVLFLVKDAPYITGQIIAVDGGRSLHLT